MTPKAVEQLLTQDARLLARRDSPVIDSHGYRKELAALMHCLLHVGDVTNDDVAKHG